MDRLGPEWLVFAWLGPPNAKSVDAQCGVSAAFAVVGTIRRVQLAPVSAEPVARFGGALFHAKLAVYYDLGLVPSRGTTPWTTPLC